MRTAIWTLILASVLASPLLAEEAEPNDLPRVLIIGDSISLGYTPFVVEKLQGRAKVVHHRGNAQHTGTGLKKLDAWVGDTKWDVIHFNWGLWDLCYRHPESKVQGRRDKERGTLTTSLEQYEKNLDELATRLNKTNAKLIWAHTTTVPEGEAGRKLGDDDRYNEVAARVMKKHGIEVNDLNTLTDTFPAKLFTAPGNVHYTKEGSSKIAEAVTAKLTAALEPESAARTWLGKDVVQILDAVERVETFRIDAALGRERKRSDPKRIAGWTRLGQGRDLTKQQMAMLVRLALSDASYVWDDQKLCIPEPGVVFRVHSKRTYVDIVMCYRCSEWSFVPAVGGKDGWEDFDPAVRSLIALAKAAFPDDETIQAL